MARKRAEGVVLILRQGLTRKGDGDTAPATGDSDSTPRYRLHRKVQNSPGWAVAPVGAMPPPSVTSHSNLSPLTVKVPNAQVHACWSSCVTAKWPRSRTSVHAP